MKQTSSLTQALTRSQESRAKRATNQTRVFRLYLSEVHEVHDSRKTRELITRYFSGATMFHASGIWQGQPEPATVIEIIGTAADFQKAVDLAGDLREVFNQDSVYLTQSSVQALDITRPEPLRTFDDVARAKVAQ